MKKVVGFVFIFAFSLSAWSHDTIRIMTINIHQGTDTCLQAIGEFIGQYKPDLVALQEVDQWPKRPEAPKQTGKNFIAELSFYADMMGYFGKAYDHPRGWDYGDGILSKYPVTEIESVILPHIGKAEPRQILIAHLNVKGHKICFASTHLAHENKANRELQINKVRSVMKKQKEKIKFVCGDLNSDPKEDLILRTMRKWTDALPEGEKTFPSYKRDNEYKYDYILYEATNCIEIINQEIICESKITDHCACIIDIVIR